MTNDKPHLILWGSGKDEPMTFHCSLCGQAFSLPKDRSPEEGVAELWAAFAHHLQENHSKATG